MKKIFSLFAIVGLIVVLSPHISFAQYGHPLPTQFSVDLTPDIPGPNQHVTAVVSSYATDLNAASISWILNGTTVSSGKGVKTFAFTMGPSNVTTILTVKIVTSDGEPLTQTFNLKPSTVDLVWQAYSYTPPFYKGKPLFSHQNEIQFVALPHILGSNGAEIPAGNLIYKWTRNGTVLGDFSGYGKNTYTMVSSVISRPLEVDVEVTSPNTDDVAEAGVTATPDQPKVVFYQNDPLYGVLFQRALTGDVAMMSGKEINVLAEPFFFDTTAFLAGSLSFTWSINGSQIDNNIAAVNRIFRQKEGVSGTSNISVTIENKDKILQFGDQNFDIHFNSTGTQGSL